MRSDQLEPGSFRDKSNRVFYREGRVLRAISHAAKAHFEALLNTKFFHELAAEGKITPTRFAPEERVPGGAPGWAAVLAHDRIPFISYPYEWSFGMLRDAAMLQLEIHERALAENMTLKDATPYNVQWQGVRPQFIDVPSIVAWTPGEPWIGYRQFCELYLNPLLLHAYRDVPFQPWLRGSINGIPSGVCSRLLRPDLFRKGVLTDVMLHAALQHKYSASTRPVGSDLKAAGFGKELILANLRRLRKLIAGLKSHATSSGWTDYAESNSYSAHDASQKAAFVKRVAAERRWGFVLDLGSNTGDYSRLASAHADYVVSVDQDPAVVDRIYQKTRESGISNWLPLTMDLADASPGLGWLGRERKRFEDRGRPDLILCLALVHHLCITANIPMNELIQWLASFGATLIIEFVTADDVMTRRLLQNKPVNHDDYDQDVFEAILNEVFTIDARQTLARGTRTLYACTPLKR